MTLRTEIVASLAMVTVGAGGYLAAGGSADLVVWLGWFLGVPLALMVGAFVAWAAFLHGVLAFAWVCSRPLLALALLGVLLSAGLTWALVGPFGAPPWVAFVVLLWWWGR